MGQTADTATAMSGDNAALRACAADPGAALATIIAIDGSFSRRVGAQLAILPDGQVVGSMADGCLETALANAAKEARGPRIVQFGGAGDAVDLRLPCGSRLSVCVDPAPDNAVLRAAIEQLDNRQEAHIAVGCEGFERQYRPDLRIVGIGTGPELAALMSLARAYGATAEAVAPLGEAGGSLALGRAPDISVDAQTAVVVLFHEHEWERALLPWALETPAFYIGAQGGAAVRETRREYLSEAGFDDAQRARVRSPVGLIPKARDPRVLALSILSEVVADFEARA